MARETFIYTRKSRALDKDTPEEELFRKHRISLFRKAKELGVADPEAHYYQEVGSSETIEGRPVFSGILKAIDRLPYQHGVDLIVPDQDRISRADLGELGDILGRLKLKGTIIRQAYGGDLDLNDSVQYNMAAMKGVFNRMVIDSYRAKRDDSWAIMLQEGEVRQGSVPWGYWWDKSERRVRDRIKPDDRNEFTDGTGLTRFQRLCLICQEVKQTSVAQLAQKYAVNTAVLFSVLSTPTIAGWPVSRTGVRRDATGKVRLDKKGRPVRYRLPREEWKWPEKPGTYTPACTLQEWEENLAAIHARKDGQVKTNMGDGICRDVVQFVGVEGPVVLGAIKKSQGNDPSYRVLPNGRNNSKGAMDVERDMVDQAASDAVRALVADPEFFAALIGDYYQARKEQEPDDADQQLRDLNQQILRFKADMDKAKRFAYAAETEAEEKEYQQDVRRLLGLIGEWEKKKAGLKAAKSPIPAVDQAVPLLLTLAQQFDPAFWADHWEAIWAKLSPATRKLLVNMCIEAVPVEYQRPEGKAVGCYRGPATRRVLPVVYSEFVRGGLAAHAAQRLLTQEIVCRRSVGEAPSLSERWLSIAALARRGSDLRSNQVAAW